MPLRLIADSHQQTFDADVFIQRIPVQPRAVARHFVLQALLRVARNRRGK